MNMAQDEHSYLFLVRFWKGQAQEMQGTQEDQSGDGWQGRVQHVVSGEARTFHDWPTLIRMLLEMAGGEGDDIATPDSLTKPATNG
jgi:hypothetical protein